MPPPFCILYKATVDFVHCYCLIAEATIILIMIIIAWTLHEPVRGGDQMTEQLELYDVTIIGGGPA
ncbi:hypothetical protein D3C73_1552730 [compost metagenome]